MDLDPTLTEIERGHLNFKLEHPNQLATKDESQLVRDHVLNLAAHREECRASRVVAIDCTQCRRFLSILELVLETAVGEPPRVRAA